MERWKEARENLFAIGAKRMSSEEWDRRCREIEELRVNDELRERERERAEKEESSRATRIQRSLQWYAMFFMPPVADPHDRMEAASHFWLGIFLLIAGLFILLGWIPESDFRAALHSHLWFARTFLGFTGWVGINLVFVGLKYLDAYRRFLHLRTNRLSRPKERLRG